MSGGCTSPAWSLPLLNALFVRIRCQGIIRGWSSSWVFVLVFAASYSVWFIRRVSLVADSRVRVKESLMWFRMILDCVLLLGAGVVGRRGGIVVAGRMGYAWRMHTAQFCWRRKWGSFVSRVAVNMCIAFWYSGECVQRNGCSCSALEVVF